MVIVTMMSLDDDHTEYTYRVEIRAGWKTVFVWLWANLFYAHRQKKWIRLLKERNAGLHRFLARLCDSLAKMYIYQMEFNV